MSLGSVPATLFTALGHTAPDYALTTGRLWSLVAAALGLVSVLAGVLTLARARRGRQGPITALASGLAGAVIGGLVVAAAEGGPGTGYGIVGGYIALAIGLSGAVIGALALLRARGKSQRSPR
ncbi:DUF6223 family protein [Nonomuraea sp. NPDC050790]|uniref:DUF6223 family protein n=1 Tax=Nonomuraea sp. NPDC050790 TaxID=3364371 RepID=UPI0037AE9635